MIQLQVHLQLPCSLISSIKRKKSFRKDKKVFFKIENNISKKDFLTFQKEIFDYFKRTSDDEDSGRCDRTRGYELACNCSSCELHLAACPPSKDAVD